MLPLGCLQSSRALCLLVYCADWPAARGGGCVGVICRVGASTHRPYHKKGPTEQHCERKRYCNTHGLTSRVKTAEMDFALLW